MKIGGHVRKLRENKRLINQALIQAIKDGDFETSISSIKHFQHPDERIECKLILYNKKQ